MYPARTASRRVSRRSLLRATAGVATAAATARLPSGPALAAPEAGQTARRPGSQAGLVQTSDPLLRALDEKIQAAMTQHQIPGVAVGVYYQG